MNRSLRTIWIALIICFLVPNITYAKWAYSFVVHKGYTYIITDDLVDKIGKEIGHVTKYSDDEGVYYGNFSNTYKKGTKYFSIPGVSTDNAIAVEDEGKYVKAIKGEKYEGRNLYIVWIVPLAMLVILVILFKKKINPASCMGI